MHKYFFIKIFAFFLVAFAWLIPSATINANERCIEPPPRPMQIDDWPTSPIGGYNLNSDSKLPDLIGYFFGWGVGLGGLAMFIALIIAGIQLITSVADPGKMNEAKGRIKSAVIGLALLLSSWAIFSLINPNLTNLSEPDPGVTKQMSTNTLIFKDRECSSREDCCKMDDPNCPPGATCPKIANPSCNLKYWACCKDNDFGCLEKGNPLELINNGGACTISNECKSQYCQSNICTPGTKSDGSSCISSGECASAFCNYFPISGGGAKCDSKKATGDICSLDKECETGKCLCDTSDWQKKCAPNPMVCNMIFDKGELGCDVVRFYELPDFAGRYIDFKYDPIYPTDSEKDELINSDWVLWQGTSATPWSGLPLSYQAFTYRRDYKGDAVKSNPSDLHPAMMPCGETACGCTVDRCTRIDAGAKCIQSSADESSGQFTEFAYNTNMAVAGVKVQDKTKFTYLQKGVDLSRRALTGAKSLWCSTIGIGCD